MFGGKRINRQWYQHVLRLCGMIGVTMAFAASVHAAGQTQIMQSAVDGSNLYLYISELAEESELTGQIAQTKAEVTEVEKTSTVHTIVLLDNSLSITEPNQAKAREILSAYVKQKEETEQVSIATFGEDIEYLAERETDADKLIEAMNSVVYANQDSFLSDILYDEIIRLGDTKEYTRFIVVADGVDNKAIGYTKEELQELLKKKNYPVYALGCIYKDNTTELENFFSIARMTKGSYFLLDDSEDTGAIVSALEGKVSRVTLEIPDNCRDGGEKSILLSVGTGEEVTELKDSASMPFQIKEEEEEPEPVVEPEPEEPVPEEPEPVEEPAGIDPITVVAVIAIIIAIVMLIVQQIMKKNKGKEKPSQEKVKRGKKEKKETMAAAMEIETPTVMVQEEERTMFLPQNDTGYIVVLKDKNEPDKIFRYPLRDRVVIGRKNEPGVNIVLNYESSVSGRHCEITNLGEHFYVEDLHSSNKTYLNGEIVSGRMEFRPGSSLKLGRLEMIVDIEKR
ncbi:MAG: FHA domain-containing protein [Eubacterium sp.]|nr:FHA domain-containing protein [Eubacterium sp.]